MGRLHVALWDDATVQTVTGRSPKFPLAERRYLLEAIRYVDGVTVLSNVSDPNDAPGAPRPAS